MSKLSEGTCTCTSAPAAPALSSRGCRWQGQCSNFKVFRTCTSFFSQCHWDQQLQVFRTCGAGPAPSLFFSTSAWHCQSASGTNSSFVRHCIYAECAQKPALHQFYVFTFHQKQLILATFLPRHCFHGTMFQIIWYHIKSIEGFNTTWFCSFWLSWKDWIEPYLTSRNDCMYLNRHIPFWRKSILPPWRSFSQVCNPRIASWCSLLLFAETSQSTNQALGLTNRLFCHVCCIVCSAYLLHIQQIRPHYQRSFLKSVKYFSFLTSGPEEPCEISFF